MKSFPAIFISHSSAVDDDQAALLSAIKDTFSNDFEILLDQDLLRAGDLWRDELHTWMALCQAAVVILSPGVIKKPDWVLKELTILTWRKSLDRDDFVLIPVLLPSVQRSDFTSDLFTPLLVGEFQMATGDTTQVMDYIAKRFEALTGSKDEPSLSRLIRKLTNKLAPLTKEDCQEAVRTLDGDPMRWDPRISPQQYLARQMVHAEFDKLCEMIIDLATEISPEAACEILEWLFTFWISRDTEDIDSS
jgi:hypothetical protein